jgi:hypothetical protein
MKKNRVLERKPRGGELHTEKSGLPWFIELWQNYVVVLISLVSLLLFRVEYRQWRGMRDMSLSCVKPG